MRSLEVGLVVAARCVWVFLMVLRSVDVLRPNVASFSCTSERASAKMSAALSSTPRVSVCPRVVVRVGPIVYVLFLAAPRSSAAGAFGSRAAVCYGSDVRCLGSRVDGVLCAAVPLFGPRRFRVRGSGRTSRAAFTTAAAGAAN